MPQPKKVQRTVSEHSSGISSMQMSSDAADHQTAVSSDAADHQTAVSSDATDHQTAVSALLIHIFLKF